jgi:hypothetical protein
MDAWKDFSSFSSFLLLTTFGIDAGWGCMYGACTYRPHPRAQRLEVCGTVVGGGRPVRAIRGAAGGRVQSSQFPDDGTRPGSRCGHALRKGIEGWPCSKADPHLLHAQSSLSGRWKNRGQPFTQTTMMHPGTELLLPVTVSAGLQCRLLQRSQLCTAAKQIHAAAPRPHQSRHN